MTKPEGTFLCTVQDTEGRAIDATLYPAWGLYKQPTVALSIKGFVISDYYVSTFRQIENGLNLGHGYYLDQSAVRTIIDAIEEN